MIYTFFLFVAISFVSSNDFYQPFTLLHTPSYHEERHKSEQNGVRRQRSSFFFIYWRKYPWDSMILFCFLFLFFLYLLIFDFLPFGSYVKHIIYSNSVTISLLP